MLRKLASGLCVLGCVPMLAACGETVSTGGFTGARRGVAQAVADFQKNVTAGDEAKVCQSNLAAAVAARLKAAGGCQALVKEQLREVDALGLTIESIALKGAASAQARVKSTWSGKDRLSTLSLVKEGGHWKIAGASR